jgi:DNA (cytosine-5)-methyltransferase 1
MLNGNAKGYLVEIFKGFEEAGYKVQLFCFNASTMGVPQRRERVFFIGHKKEFDLPKLVMEFNEVPIPLKEFYRYEYGRPLTGKYLNLWYKVKPGDTFDKATGKSWFSKRKLSPDVVLPTLTAHCVTDMCMYDSPKKIPRETIIQGGSFPLDYNFIDVEPGYLVGMSVPPIMTAQVACKVYEQWLSKL